MDNSFYSNGQTIQSLITAFSFICSPGNPGGILSFENLGLFFACASQTLCLAGDEVSVLALELQNVNTVQQPDTQNMLIHLTIVIKNVLPGSTDMITPVCTRCLVSASTLGCVLPLVSLSVFFKCQGFYNMLMSSAGLLCPLCFYGRC